MSGTISPAPIDRLGRCAVPSPTNWGAPLDVDTRVLVRDGETVVMGGLTVTERGEVRSGIPLLMDLPLLGGLFRTTSITETQRDLMILVTPNIVQRTF